MLSTFRQVRFQDSALGRCLLCRLVRSVSYPRLPLLVRHKDPKKTPTITNKALKDGCLLVQPLAQAFPVIWRTFKRKQHTNNNNDWASLVDMSSQESHWNVYYVSPRRALFSLFRPLFATGWAGLGDFFPGPGRLESKSERFQSSQPKETAKR